MDNEKEGMDNTNLSTGLEGLGRCIGDVNALAGSVDKETYESNKGSENNEIWLDINKLKTDKNEYLKEWMRKTEAFGINDIDDDWFSVTIKSNNKVYIVTACGNEAYGKCINAPGANYVAFVTKELGLMDKSEVKYSNQQWYKWSKTLLIEYGHIFRAGTVRVES